MEQSNQRKRICFLTHDLMVGGLENVLVEALNTLHDKYKIRVICLYGEFQKAVTDRFPQDVEVEFKNMPRNRFTRKPFFSRLYFRKALGKEAYDYIIALKGFERLAWKAKGNSKFIYWCFNDFHSRYLQKNLTPADNKLLTFEKKLYRNIDAVWTVTSGIAEESNAVYCTDIFHPLPLSIDCTAIAHKAEQSCCAVFDSSKVNVVLLGRISPEKGFTRVLQMMPRLANRFPNMHLHIIGGGNALSHLQNKCIEKGLAHQVTFWGEQLNPFPYLKQAQLFISPSVFESFGLVMMEAMFLGIPLIATATTGGKYVTQNGTYGICVDNTDNALENAITEFLNAPGSYRCATKEAQQWAQSHDRPHFAQRLLNLLDRL